MADDAAISGEPYQPDDDLRELLEAFQRSARLVDKSEQEIEAMGTRAIRTTYRLEHDDVDADVTETQSIVGVLVSADGAIGLLAANVLASALRYGTPTLVYTDEVDLTPVETYRDVTVEWYNEEVQDEEFLESRREQHAGREAIEIETLEDMAEIYLGE
jgi:hypothetical protein